jgi:hypothetical protein
MSMVEALLEERRGYVVRGLTARVAAVDAALLAFGVAVGDDTPETPDGLPANVERAVKGKKR